MSERPFNIDFYFPLFLLMLAPLLQPAVWPSVDARWGRCAVAAELALGAVAATPLDACQRDGTLA